MTDREKLIELLMKADVEDEISENTTEHRAYTADLMFANGVTFATDTNVGGKWIPVTERLPEQLEFVLVTDGGEVFAGMWSLTFDEIVVVCKKGRENGKRFIATHWMPLPEPPKECSRGEWR